MTNKYYHGDYSCFLETLLQKTLDTCHESVKNFIYLNPCRTDFTTCHTILEKDKLKWMAIAYRSSWEHGIIDSGEEGIYLVEILHHYAYKTDTSNYIHNRIQDPVYIEIQELISYKSDFFNELFDEIKGLYCDRFGSCVTRWVL